MCSIAQRKRSLPWKPAMLSRWSTSQRQSLCFTYSEGFMNMATRINIGSQWSLHSHGKHIFLVCYQQTAVLTAQHRTLNNKIRMTIDMLVRCQERYIK